MLMMRLQRIGRKNDPSFRVVVTDKRNGPRAGNHADTIGSYNPKLGKFQIDAEKAKEWIAKGVQPSDTIHNFLVSEGIIEGKKRNVLSKKTPIVSEKPAEEVPAAPEVSTEETPAAPEASVEEPAKEEAPTEEAPAEEAPAEEPAKEDSPAEEEKPVEETKEEQAPEEEKTEEAPEEEKPQA